MAFIKTVNIRFLVRDKLSRTICTFKTNAIERCSLHIRQELETLDGTDDEEISLPSSTFYKSIRPIDLGSVTIRNVGFAWAEFN